MSRRFHFGHPNGHDFVGELSSKLEKIQRNLGPGQAIVLKDQDEYELTKPRQRRDVILYLLSCNEHPPDVQYSRYAKPKPIDNAVLEDIKRLSGNNLIQRAEGFRIIGCNSQPNPVARAAYEVRKLTGQEYVALLFLYTHRDTRIEGYLMSDLFRGYAKHVWYNVDPDYSNTSGALASLQSKLQLTMAPTLTVFSGLNLRENSNSAGLSRREGSEDTVIRYILFCHDPPNDYY